MKTFGQLVREARENLGWSQALVAQALGTKHSAVSMVETGARLPSLKKTVLWAWILQTEHKELVRAILQDKLDAAGLNYVVTLTEKA